METANPLSPRSNESITASNMSSESSDSRKSKRFIPDHKKPDAALTFPEKVRNYTLFELNCFALPPSQNMVLIRFPLF
jgi:hypothetical protein